MPTKGVRMARDPARPVAFDDGITPTGGGGPVTTSLNLNNLGVIVGALIENTGNGSVRYRVDGGTPTNSSGHRLMPGAADYLNEHELRKVQFAADSGASTITMTVYAE